MIFKSSNYFIKDHTVDIFETLLETNSEVNNLIVTDKNELYYSQDNFVYKYNNTKKLKSYKNITYMDYFDDILLLGDEWGNIKIYSDNILIRTYKEHTNRINQIIKIDHKNFISCSDDGSVKIFNIENEQSYKTLDWFNDKVKSICISDGVLYIGVINQMIYGVCLSTYKQIFEKNTNLPISQITVKDRTIYFISKNKLYRMNNEIVHLISHIKHITDLKIVNDKIHTVSQDGYMKITSMEGQIIEQVNLRSPIQCFSIKEGIIYFGLKNGQICKIGNIQEIRKKKKFVNRNLREYESEIQYKLVERENMKCNKLEKLFMKYEYRGALIEALNENNFKDIFATLQYLKQVHKLRNAVSNLEIKHIEKLLDFISLNFQVKELFDVFYDLLSILLSVYFQELQENEELYEKLCYLSYLVDEECLFEEKAIELFSYIECLE